MDLNIVILAAGLGKRMNSALPKVLQPIGGIPMIGHVLSTAKHLSPSHVFVIYGASGEILQETLKEEDIRWVEQATPQGTGHAVSCALPHLSDNSHTLILLGDTPLIEAKTLLELVKTTPSDSVGLITARVSNPTGFGRIVRDDLGKVVSIVEEKDATADQKTIHEINSGIFWVPTPLLKKWIPLLTAENAQKEYYLTDIISMATKEGRTIHAIVAEDENSILGANDLVQLSQLERFYQRRQAIHWMRQGVRMADPHRVDIRGNCVLAPGVFLDVNVILDTVKLGPNVVVGAHSVLQNTTVEDGVRIEPFSFCEGAKIASHAKVGPYARLRSGTVLKEGAQVGNFVEIKKATIGKKSKANHLTYIGDAIVGEHVNIGAGTITCNYDGAYKHQTIIHDRAFIGSHTALIAPVEVGCDATIGAGTILSKNAPEHQLTLSRSPQKSVAHWKRPAKKEEG